jgi:hypothetical protein
MHVFVPPEWDDRPKSSERGGHRQRRDERPIEGESGCEVPPEEREEGARRAAAWAGNSEDGLEEAGRENRRQGTLFEGKCGR